MANEIYAFIKDGIVVDTAVFDNPSQELLNLFKEEKDVDEIVNTNGNWKAVITGIYEDGYFWPLKPYPSWIKKPQGNWDPPVPHPDPTKPDGWWWDEENLQWVVIPQLVDLEALGAAPLVPEGEE